MASFRSPHASSGKTAYLVEYTSGGAYQKVGLHMRVIHAHFSLDLDRLGRFQRFLPATSVKYVLLRVLNFPRRNFPFADAEAGTAIRFFDGLSAVVVGSNP